MDSIINFIDSLPKIPSFVPFIILVIGIFLLARFLVLWYWRVNEIVDLLKKIEWNTNPENNRKKDNPTS
jgi:hypothetical protein